MITKIHYKDRDEWLGIRNDLVYNKSMLGASSIATACGMSKYGSPIRMFYEYIGQVTPNKKSKRMLFGLRVEPEIRFQYQTYDSDEMTWIQNMEQGVIVNPIEEVNYVITNSNYEGYFASLDFLAIKGDFRVPVDSKSTQFVVWKSWNGVIPTDYQAQLEIQCMLFESEYGELSCLVEESIHNLGYNVNLDFRAELIRKSTEFIDRVKAGKQVMDLMRDPKNTQKDLEEYQAIIDSLAPNVDGLDDTNNFYLEKYSQSEPVTIKGSDIAQQYRDSYVEALELENKAKKTKQEARNFFIKEMKEAEKMELDNGIVTYRRGLKDYFSCK